MTTTNDFDAAIEYYLSRLSDGPINEKNIQNGMRDKFKVSGAAVRNKLLDLGMIKLKEAGYDKKRLRNIYMVELVGQQEVTKIKRPEPEHKSVVIETHWPEGWPKSHGDAFDWRNTAQGLFSKAELAAMQTKIKRNPNFTGRKVHVYSKA